MCIRDSHARKGTPGQAGQDTGRRELEHAGDTHRRHRLLAEVPAPRRDHLLGQPAQHVPAAAQPGAAAGPVGGAGLGRGRDVLRRLAEQVVAPVRWDLCQRTMATMGVTGMVELAPAGVLTGLARRTLPGVETVAVTSPADLDAARDLIARHSLTITDEEAPA